jgi:hypothetical protein
MSSLSLVSPGPRRIQLAWRQLRHENEPIKTEEVVSSMKKLTKKAIFAWKNSRAWEDEESTINAKVPLPSIQNSESTQENSSREAYNRKEVGLLPAASVVTTENLPNEILSLIFEKYVHMGYSTISLAGVSKEWDQIILRTPSLWGTIRIGSLYSRDQRDRFTVGPDTIYYREGSQLCSSEEELKKALRRSGACPLDIAISYQTGFGCFDYDFIKALQLLNKSPRAANIKSLSIYVDNIGRSTIFPDMFSRMSLRSLENLELLCAPRQWHANLMSSISETCERLQTLKNIDAVSLLTLPNEVCQGVTDVFFPDRVFPKDVDRVITKFPRIQRLENLPAKWPSEDSPPAVLYRVQKVDLETDPGHFRCIEWPVLKWLTINEWRAFQQDHNPPLPFITLPSLESFTLTADEPYKWLSNISMPRLTSLEIRTPYSYIDSGGLKENPLSILPAVKTFCLASETCDATIIPFLEAIPNVVSVFLRPTEHDILGDEFAFELIPRLTEYKNGFLLCPKLQNLELGEQYNGVGDWERRKLLPMIRRLIRARSIHDCPLRKMNVFWDGNKLAHPYT